MSAARRPARTRRGRSTGQLVQRTLVVERSTAMAIKPLVFWDAVSSTAPLFAEALTRHGFAVRKGLVEFGPDVASLRFGGKATVVTAIDVKKGLAIGHVVATRNLEREVGGDPGERPRVVERILAEAHAELEDQAVRILSSAVSALLSPRPGSPLERAYRETSQAALAELATRTRKVEAAEAVKAAKVVEVGKALDAPFPIYRGPFSPS